MSELRDPRPGTWKYRAVTVLGRVVAEDDYADDREARAWGAQLARQLGQDVIVERHGLDGWVDITP